MRTGSSSDQITTVSDHLVELGFVVHPIVGVEKTVIGAVGAPDVDKYGAAEQLRAYDFVEDVVFVGKPYKFVAREYRPEGSVIDVGGVKIGGQEITMMAGPCTVESEAQLMTTAEAVAKAGAKILRGGAYKPSTSPYSYQGMGIPALELLREAGKRFNLKVITEVMDPRKVELVCEYADILQVGTRNMQNYDLLREVGLARKPIMLKRGMSAKLEEWLLAAEYIAQGGNEQILLCERGIRSFDGATRNVLDLAAVPMIKRLSHLPIIVDPSQGTGRRDLIAPMSMAAIAAGADGLIIEVHPNPDHAIKDGAQSVTIPMFESLVPNLKRIAESVDRCI
ncbi:MAG TPA: 3-deoxy-7-phosphoheptulonate synthase [Fimbriimonadaceae bacterium]|nr:3-deoxy-7-phosphoheptulonate synthase [Fimbriimonadaceae bacterium]